MSTSSLTQAYRHLKQGRPTEAVPLLERLTKQTPTYVTPHALLAWAYEMQEQWPQALDLWQHAYFLMPNSPTIDEGLQRAMTAVAELPAGGTRTPSQEAPPPAPDEPEPEQPTPDAAQEEHPDDSTAPPPESPPPTATTSSPAQLLSELTQSDAPHEPLSAPGEFENLDRLIDELERARIEPQPDVDEIPAPDLDNEIEDVVSETLARIYVAQEQYAEAARVYEKLADQMPDRADHFMEKAAQMKRQAQHED